MSYPPPFSLLVSFLHCYTKVSTDYEISHRDTSNLTPCCFSLIPSVLLTVYGVCFRHFAGPALSRTRGARLKALGACFWHSSGSALFLERHSDAYVTVLTALQAGDTWWLSWHL